MNLEMVKMINGDATYPIGNGKRIIAHICNNRGGWGRGFVLAINKRWSKPELSYRNWCSRNLGFVQFVDVGDGIRVANMIAQEGFYAEKSTPPIRYEALTMALNRVCREAKNTKATVHMPKIGAGLAGGDWEKIYTIIEKIFVDVDAYVYYL